MSKTMALARAAGFALAFALSAGGCRHYDTPSSPRDTEVTFLSLEADGSAGTTELRLKFSRNVPRLSAADIAFEDPSGTGIRKGVLVSYGGGAYTLAVSGVERDGTVTVTVHKAGYAFAPPARTAPVYASSTEVRFVSLMEDGVGAAETTALTLTFSKAVPDLSAEDITLTDTGGTGIRVAEDAGALSGPETGAGGETVYTLAVNGVGTSGVVTVKVHKEGYAFKPDARTATVFPPSSSSIRAQFELLTADWFVESGTTLLTLAFDQSIAELSSGNITLADPDGTGIRKGALTALGGGSYRLAVSGVAKAGDVTVRVRKGGYAFTPESRVVRVSPPSSLLTEVAFLSLTADGAAGTAALTLTFSGEIPALTTNIALEDPDGTGIQKGALTALGSGSYRLAVSGVAKAGDVTVRVSKDGYLFTPESRTVRVSPSSPPTEVTFQSLTADGSETATTTALTLTFSGEIPALTSENILLADPDGTGIRAAEGAGALTALGGGSYRLAVSGVAKTGTVSVTAAKAGYVFKPGTLTAKVWNALIGVTFQSLTADWLVESGTAALTLTFSKAVPDLSADDITLTGGTGIRKGALTAFGNGSYKLAVGGVNTDGTVTVRVHKAGYAFAPDTLSAQVRNWLTTVQFRSLTADGSATETTALTLTFGKAVERLSADDITFTDTGGTGIQKGALTALGGGSYRLAVSGVAKPGTVWVRAAKAGYVFEPNTLTAQVTALVRIAFKAFEASGSDTETTETLTLAFDKAVEGLSADDITLTDTGGTGIQKGALGGPRSGYDGIIYTLAVSGVERNGTVTATVRKAGYAFAPDTRTATAHLTTLPPASTTQSFLSLTANGSETAATTALKLIFDSRVPWLTADAITLVDPYGTGIRKVALSPVADLFHITSYTLTVNEISRGGDVTVKIAPMRDPPYVNVVKPESRTVAVYSGLPKSQEPPLPPVSLRAQFVSLEANGSPTTTALTLAFNRVLAGLSADDITLTDTDGTGIIKGALSGPAPNADGIAAYTLAVSGIRGSGDVTVKVQKSRNPLKVGFYYSVTPDSRTVRVHRAGGP